MSLISTSEPILKFNISLLSTDNYSTRKSPEKGWIQSESVPTTSEWNRGEHCKNVFFVSKLRTVGEHWYKYWSFIHAPQPCKFLVDTVFAKGMTVRQSKEELLPQLKEQCKLDLSIDR